MIKTTTKSIFKSLALGSAFLMAAYSASAQAPTPLTTMGTPATKDFDGLAGFGTTNPLFINGLVMSETGTASNGQYAGGTGSSGTGDTYSFGASSGATDRSFGGLQSGTLNPTIGIWYTNNTGATINSLQIAYTGEQWRCGTISRNDSLKFQYSTNASSLTTGTWTDVPALSFKSANTAATGLLDGNLPANRTAIAFTITSLTIPDGTDFFVRWVDFNASGADDGLSVDDWSITPMSALPQLNVNNVTMNEGNAGTTTFTFSVSLTAPAGVGGVTFDITSADGTATSPIDYIANTMPAQTIAAGNTSYTFSVSVNGDVVVEPNDTFYVNVSNVTGASIGNGQGIGIIVNDDYVAPLVVGQPSNTTVCAGDVAMFSAQATGDPTPTVQWQVSTDGGGSWNDILSATASTYSFTASSTQDGDMYWAIFTNGGGADTTNAVTLTVNPTYSLSESFSVCSGDDYTFPDGSTATNITNTIVHLSSLNTVAGCDSNIVTTINVNPVYNINETVAVCSGNNYTYPDGTVANNVTSTVSHTSNLTTMLGCDSIINTTVNVNPIDTTTATPQSICTGDSALFYGNYISTAGMHYHALTNMFGCDSVIELNLTVNSLPTAAYSSVVTDGTADFTNMSTGAIFYSWDFGDASTSPASDPSHTYSSNAIYTVCLTAVSSNGCMDSVCSPVTIQAISLKKLNASVSISVYPNPAKDNVTVAFASEVKTGTVKLINALGQVILSKEVKNTSAVEINLNNINNGVYFIQIENNGTKTIKRLIVE